MQPALPIHLNGQLYATAEGPEGGMMQALHAVQPLYVSTKLKKQTQIFCESFLHEYVKILIKCKIFLCTRSYFLMCQFVLRSITFNALPYTV